jgi:hypothetical protein
MALVKPVLQRPDTKLMQTFVQTYPAITGSDTTAPVAVGDLSELTVQAYGSFTGGGSVKIQGSNDPRVISDSANAVWFDCTTDGTNALSFSAVGAKNMHEHPIFIKAVPTGTLAGVLLAISGKRMVH